MVVPAAQPKNTVLASTTPADFLAAGKPPASVVPVAETTVAVALLSDERANGAPC